jgi:hypothetical protein
MWRVVKPFDEHDPVIRQLAADVDHVLRLALDKASVETVSELSDDSANKLCKEIAALIAGKAKVNVAPDAVDRTAKGAQVSLGIVEFWIYRDWQSGIGDWMLTNITNSARRYDVIGFRDFEQRCIENSKEDQRWLDRLKGVFEKLNLEGPEILDARVGQLRALRDECQRIDALLSKLRAEPKESQQPTNS